MLERLSINAFKSIEKQSFELKPLTILTGTNASGKSSVIQSILIGLSAFEQKNQPYLDKIIAPYLDFEDVHCRWSDALEVSIVLETQKRIADYKLQAGRKTQCSVTDPDVEVSYERDYFYLSANRIGPEEISQIDKHLKVGEQGQFVLASFEACKDKPVDLALRQPKAVADTLKAQVAYWLSEILGTNAEFKSEKITSNSVKNSFSLGDLGEISPLNTGAGNSYLVKILIMGLLTRPGQLLLIENPEIHLHPKAQSMLAVFMAHLTAAGVQVVVETHCDHFINRVRYQVYTSQLKHESVQIYYKPSERELFVELRVNKNGHFVNSEGERTSFPNGFFDASLASLLEIG
jgi:predicted ATPase